MHILCPHCQNPIELVKLSMLDEIACPSCGSSFRIETDSTTDWKPQEDKRLGRFELIDKVGHGAFGTVWKAKDPELDRIVAIKLPRAGNFADKDDLDRFLREARSVAQLRHSSIVTIHEVGRVEDMPYLVSDFVEGVTLADILSARRLPLREAAQIVASVADALHYAHVQGVVHRDVKPSNIMMGDDNKPHVMDFGLAKRDAGEITMTVDGQVLGTPAYMSPEQAKGESHLVDGRSDVYSLGVIFYQMLTGELPFRGTTRMLMHQVLHDEPKSLRSLNDRIPRDLQTICLKAMAKEPGRRYDSAKDLADDLQLWLNGQPIRSRPVGHLERALRWCQRNPTLATMAASIVFVTIVGFAGVIWQWRDAEIARKRADDNANKANIDKEAALRQSYRASMAAASSAWHSHNARAAREALLNAPTKYRDWEWRHFYSKLDEAVWVRQGSQERVHSIAFGPDGKYLIAAAGDKSVHIWEVANGRQFAKVRDRVDGTRAVAATPRGFVLLTQNKLIRLSKNANPEENVIVPPYSRFSFSPRGEILAVVGTNNDSISLFDVGKMQKSAVLLNKGIVACVFNQNATQLAVGFFNEGSKESERYSIRIWNAKTGTEVTTLRGHRHFISCLAFSPSGKHLVSGSFHPENSCKLWDVATGKSIEMKGHKNGIMCVAFSPDGKRIVSASRDQTARLWDGNSAELVAALTGHYDVITDVAFNGDGSRLITCSEDETLRLWDSQSGDLLAVLHDHTDKVTKAVFGPDSALIASASDDKTVRLWDTKAVERRNALRGHTGFVYDVAFSPNGKQIASAAWDGTVRLWDVQSGKQDRALKHKTRNIISLAFHPTKNQLVSFSNPGGLFLWNLTTFDQIPTRFPHGKIKDDSRLAFSSDGKLLVVQLKENVQVWNASITKLIAEFQVQGERAQDAAFSPNGKVIAVAAWNNDVHLWNVAARKTIAVLKGHEHWVETVEFSPDGKWIASGSHDTTVRIWDARTHKKLATLPNASGVYDVAFHPLGHRLAVACSDNSIRLWDLRSFKQVAELHGHRDYVHAVDFSPDGKQLASASGDHTVRIWDTVPLSERLKQRNMR